MMIQCCDSSQTFEVRLGFALLSVVLGIMKEPYRLHLDHRESFHAVYEAQIHAP